MKKFIVGIFVAFGFYIPTVSFADQNDRINAEVAAIAKDIKENGPPELRKLPYSVISKTAMSFVTGRESGAISPAAMDRMGGARGATESSLRGQLKASGAW